MDGDTAIVGLMARHPLRGTTMWGQPYGSPLDGWVAAPFVAAFGPTPLAVRIPYALLALALVAAAGAWAELARAGAGLPAALLVACPSAYVLLLSALPPPFYPTTLVLLAAPDPARRARRRGLPSGTPPARGSLVLIGALGGLAVWTHLMSLATVAAVGPRARPWRRRARARGALVWPLAAFLAASAPWWIAACASRRPPRSSASRTKGAAPLAHAATVARRLHEPVAAVLGAWSPLTADEAERTVAAPPHRARRPRRGLAGGGAVAGWTVLRGAADRRNAPGT